MSRFYLFLLMVGLCAAMAGTSGAMATSALKIVPKRKNVETKADIAGRIVKINRPQANSMGGDFLGSVYVEGAGNYDRASVSINRRTRIFISGNGVRKPADFDVLKVGARVEATFTGPVLESYPVQATAGEIVVFAAASADQPPPHDKTALPLTKTDYLIVEGSQRRPPVRLRLFDEVDLPFAAYYPENDLTAETNASDEGQSLRFVSKIGGRKNENAYVHIFSPYAESSLRQVRQLVSGNRGLLRSNGWRTRNLQPPNRAGNSSWAKERIFFRGKSGRGFILIGSQQNRAFYAIVHCPPELAKEFTPRAEVILKNLIVKFD